MQDWLTPALCNWFDFGNVSNILNISFLLSSQSNGVAVVWGFGQNYDITPLLMIVCFEIGKTI